MDITECAASICTNSDRVVWDTGHIFEEGVAKLAQMRLGRRTSFVF